MIKTAGADGTSAVTFTLDPKVGARVAVVCGEWNGWAPDIHVMERDERGGFALTIALEPGRRYRFRYLLDHERWENDWAADAYEPNAFGQDDSIVDLTASGGGATGGPVAPTKAPARKAAPRKATPTKAATNVPAKAPAKTPSKAPTKAPSKAPTKAAAEVAPVVEAVPPPAEPLSKKAAKKAARKAAE
jgi:hypothetical protein